MASWTTEEMSLPSRGSSNEVSRTFQNRDPQYIVVEVTGVVGTPTIGLQDSSDGAVYVEVANSGALTPVGGRVVWRFNADENNFPVRNICRITLNSATFSKVYVTWSP